MALRNIPLFALDTKVFISDTRLYHSKSKMISRRQGEGDDAYCTYVEEADDAANKDSALS
jgi:hypothetical protein